MNIKVTITFLILLCVFALGVGAQEAILDSTENEIAIEEATIPLFSYTPEPVVAWSPLWLAAAGALAPLPIMLLVPPVIDLALNLTIVVPLIISSTSDNPVYFPLTTITYSEIGNFIGSDDFWFVTAVGAGLGLLGGSIWLFVDWVSNVPGAGLLSLSSFSLLGGSIFTVIPALVLLDIIPTDPESKLAAGLGGALMGIPLVILGIVGIVDAVEWNRESQSFLSVVPIPNGLALNVKY